MRNIIVLLLALLIFSCDPPMNCNDPECGSSPINLKLNATISDTSQVLYLGDTVTFSIIVPDTIETNYGNYKVSAIDGRSTWFSIDYSFVDTIYANGTGKFDLLNKTIHFSKGGFNKNGPKTAAVYFDGSSKSVEFSLIPSKKGRYYIASSIQSSRFVFKEEDKDWLLSMLNVGLDTINQHHELYLSWIPDLEQRVLMSHALRDRKKGNSFWYAFEVK